MSSNQSRTNSKAVIAILEAHFRMVMYWNQKCPELNAELLDFVRQVEAMTAEFVLGIVDDVAPEIVDFDRQTPSCDDGSPAQPSAPILLARLLGALTEYDADNSEEMFLRIFTESLPFALTMAQNFRRTIPEYFGGDSEVIAIVKEATATGTTWDTAYIDSLFSPQPKAD